MEVGVDGRLHVHIEGSPADLAWPYPCPVATFNALKRQPNGGLWVPPSVKVSQLDAFGTTGGAHITVPAALTTIDTATISITNPSTCFTAMVFRWISVDVDLFLPPGTDSEAVVLLNGNEMSRDTNPAPAAGSEMAVHHELVLPQLFSTLAPGATTSFPLPIQVRDGDGGAMYGQDRWAIRAIVLAVP